MNFKEYIEKGEEIAGGRAELARILNQKANALTDAKRGVRGLPDAACLALGELVGMVEPLHMIAVRNEWTAKDADEKELWRPFAARATLAQHANRIMTFAFIAACASLWFVQPSPAEAHGVRDTHSSSVYYVNNVCYQKRTWRGLGCADVNAFPRATARRVG